MGDVGLGGGERGVGSAEAKDEYFYKVLSAEEYI